MVDVTCGASVGVRCIENEILQILEYPSNEPAYLTEAFAKDVT